MDSVAAAAASDFANMAKHKGDIPFTRLAAHLSAHGAADTLKCSSKYRNRSRCKGIELNRNVTESMGIRALFCDCMTGKSLKLNLRLELVTLLRFMCA